MNDKRKATNYSRWSDELQRGNTSKPRQKTFAQEVCDELGLELVDTIIDDGVSSRFGDNLKANFATAIDTIEAGDYFIIEEWSRLSRAGFWVTVDALRPLIDKGIRVIIGRDEDNELIILDKVSINKTSMIRKVVDGSQEAKSENERRINKLDDAWIVRRDLLKEGKYTPLAALPGWLSQPRDENTGRCIKNAGWIVDDEKKKIIKYVFELYVKEKTGTRKLAQLLNLQKIPRVSSDRKKPLGEWTPESLIILLKNKAVIGYYEYRQYHEERMPDNTKPMGYRKKKWYGPKEWESKVFPPVIDEVLFYQAQKQLEVNRNVNLRSRTTPNSINLFTGLLQCKCGGYLFQDAKRTVGLRCKNRSRGTCIFKRQGFIKSRVEFAFKNLLEMSNIIDSIFNTEQQLSPSMVPSLQAELDKLRKERRNLYTALKKLDTQPDDLIKDIQTSLDEEKRIQKQIDAENIRLKGNEPVKQAISGANQNIGYKSKVFYETSLIRPFVMEAKKSLMYGSKTLLNLFT
jgi:hypothetical protein